MTRFLVCLSVLLCTASVSKADLVEFTDTFGNGFGGSTLASPSNWDLSLPLISSTFLQSNAGDDSLLDDENDGYATLNGSFTGNGSSNFSPAMTREIGVVEASDVGMLVKVDLAYLTVSGGAPITAGIASNGVFLESKIGTDPDGAVSASYIVEAADIGSTLDVQFEFETENDSWTMAMDAAIVTITAIPEPSSLVLLTCLAGVVIPMRRRVA